MIILLTFGIFGAAYFLAALVYYFFDGTKNGATLKEYLKALF